MTNEEITRIIEGLSLRLQSEVAPIVKARVDEILGANVYSMREQARKAIRDTVQEVVGAAIIVTVRTADAD
jgi:uncharacterized membrane protein